MRVNSSGEIVISVRSYRQIGALFLTASVLAFSSNPAQAQSVPDAGSLQRELRQGLPGAISRSSPAPAAASPSEGLPEGEKVRVERFTFEGATLLPETQLESATQSFAGRELSLQDIRAAAQAVADLYRRHGYFARTILPPQDVSGGTVWIRVIEGRFGQILTDDRADRANGKLVERILGGRLAEGQPYSDRDLERGLLLANDLPGVRADGVLKAGNAQGTSDLALTVTDTAFVTGSIGGDNGGVDATGIVRAVGSLAFNNLTGKGDQITLLGLGSRHLGYGQIGWSIPLGTGGWRAGVYASYMRYTLGGDFADLDGRGHADTQGLELSYPVIRSTTQNLRLRAAYEHGHYHDDVLGKASHRKQLHRIALSLEGDGIDSIGGGGRSQYSVTMALGSLDLGGSTSDLTLDSLTTDANGAWAKIEVQATRDQQLAGPVFLRLHANGQWAMNNLDSSEQFALGGPYGVRAFPVNEAMGDRGTVANAELHLPVTGGFLKGLDLFGFVDGGVIQLHTRTWANWNLPDADNVYNLAGAGAGINYALPYGIAISAVVAAPITDNPGGADRQHNQDGSKRNVRGWLNLSKTF